MAGDSGFLTLGEVAAALRCSESTVRRAVAGGRLGAVVVSERVVRVPVAEFERFTGMAAAGGAGGPVGSV